MSSLIFRGFGMGIWSVMLAFWGLSAAYALPALNPEKALSQYVHESWTVEDGLPSVEVQGLLQTRDGYLWISTRNGLARFDGLNFEVFDLDNTEVFRSHRFGPMVEGTAGELWVGSRGGLYRYQDGRFTSHFVGDSAADDVRALLIDLSGNLWSGSVDGLLRWGTDSVPKVEQRLLRDVEVSSLLQDPDGTLWAGAYGEGVFRCRGDRCDRIRPEARAPEGGTGSFVIGFWRAVDGRVLVATESGIGRIEGDRWVSVDDSAELGNKKVLALWRDPVGTLWLGTEGGLRRARGDRFDELPLISERLGIRLRSYNVTCVYGDREGHLWFGSYGQGLHRLKEGPVTNYSTLEGLTDSTIFSVFQSRDGSLLIGDAAGGLNRLRDGRVEILWRGSDMPFDSVFTWIEDSSGRLWAGTRSGLFRIDRRNRIEPGSIRRWSSDEGLPHPWVRVIYPDPVDESKMWIGTYGGGVSLLSGDRLETPSGLQHLSDGQVRSLLKDRHGSLWVGTERGLNRYRDGRVEVFTSEHGLGSNSIRPMLEDSDGTLWIGTAGGGLARFRDGRIRAYTKSHGLPQGDVWALIEDDEGSLWWSTDDGILRADRSTFDAYDGDPGRGLSIRVYDQGDGMKHVEGNGHGRPGAWKDSNGDIWIISTAGVNRIDPRHRNELEPSVWIQSVVAGDRRFAPEDPLSFSHRQRDLEIRYTAISFSRPEKLRFRYRLMGYDDAWQEVGGRRTAYFTNLPSGRFTFEVMAANEDGVWSGRKSTAEMVIQAPPWRSPWAYLAYVALAVGGGGLVVRRQRHRLARERGKRRREAERDRRIIERLQEVDRLKDEFLANTSHELRTPLHGMMGLAGSLVSGARGELPAEVLDDLALLESSGRRLSHLVDEILDFSKLRHRSVDLALSSVDLSIAFEVVLSLLRPLAEERGIELRQAALKDLPAVSADENRLQQILHNLIGNAIKFTHEGHVEVSARRHFDEVVIRVSDTGEGIVPERQTRIFEAFAQVDSTPGRQSEGTGLGLAVTAELVELHGGRLWVESVPGQGSDFFVSLSVATLSEATSSEATPSEATPSEATPSKAPSSELTQREATDEHLPLKAERLTMESPLRPAAAYPSPRAGIDPSRRERILVVDDQAINLQVVANYLAVESYEVETATSGAEALELFEQRAYDLVLLDVMMPRLSGFEVCRAMRRRLGPEKLPILFLSAVGQETGLISGLEEGGNDYLTKPIGQRELLARVRLHLDLLNVHRKQAEEIDGLRGLLPICASCKSIRDDRGYWNRLENFFEQYSEAQLSHGICPDCADRLYGEISSSAEG